MLTLHPLELPLDWFTRLERRLGFLAMPNAILAVILGQAAATLLAQLRPELPLLLYLDPVAVWHGQWWRLFTWIFVPSGGTKPLDLFLAFFWFWFLWIIGRSLENAWGPFRATLYLILGLCLPAAGSLLLYALFGVVAVQTGFYFSVSLQLAFAALAPDFTIYLLFLLPVKMRWLAWGLGAWMLWGVAQTGLRYGGGAAFIEGLSVAFGVGNYLLYFLPGAWQAARQRRQVQANRQVFEKAKVEVQALQTRNCERCGAGPEADLRLCTCERCGEDGKNWCQAHLSAHLEDERAEPVPSEDELPRPPVRPTQRTKLLPRSRSNTKTKKRKG
jgi:hypothetical protein